VGGGVVLKSCGRERVCGDGSGWVGVNVCFRKKSTWGPMNR